MHSPCFTEHGPEGHGKPNGKAPCPRLKEDQKNECRLRRKVCTKWTNRKMHSKIRHLEMHWFVLIILGRFSCTLREQKCLKVNVRKLCCFNKSHVFSIQVRTWRHTQPKSTATRGTLPPTAGPETRIPHSQSVMMRAWVSSTRSLHVLPSLRLTKQLWLSASLQVTCYSVMAGYSAADNPRAWVRWTSAREGRVWTTIIIKKRTPSCSGFQLPKMISY